MAASQYVLTPKRAPRHLRAQQLHGRKASKASQAKRSEPVSHSNTHNTCSNLNITEKKLFTYHRIQTSHNKEYKLHMTHIKQIT